MQKLLSLPLFSSGQVTKTWLRIMKLIAIFLLALSMHLSARVTSQTITYIAKDVKLVQVFKIIKQQTGYVVLYNPAHVLDYTVPFINANQTPVKDFFKMILQQSPFEFSIEDKNIIVSKKPVLNLNPKINEEATPPITGVVRDLTGAAINGATVTNKVTKKSVQTNAKGEFNIDAKEGDVLIFTSIGYGQKEITVRAYNEIGVVQLAVSESKLDEVQIIAYGKTTQRLSTGNVTTIKADVIEKQPVNNPLLALQGRVPGLFIEQATGFAGTGVKVRIQGQNSMLNGSEPLYIVDGMPYPSQLIKGGNPILGFSESGAGNPLNFINPSDIESISVLKDADATAIYGSRAANGAILITTKKGMAGDIRVDANLQSGWGTVARKLDLMDSRQYLEMRYEALKNDGITEPVPGPYGDTDLNGSWDKNQNKDWQHEMIGGTAQYRDINVSISGGSTAASYLVGANYHKETNVFPGDFADTKGSVHFNINSSSVNQKFRMQFSGLYLTNNNLLPQIDLTGSAITLPPVAPNLFNEDGSLNWQPNSDGQTTFFNPMSYIFGKNQIKTNNLIGSGIVSYQVIKSLEFKANVGYSALQSNGISYITSSGIIPDFRQYTPRSTAFFNSNDRSWSIEPQLRYSNFLSKGKLEILLGATIQKQNKKAESFSAEGFPSDQVMEDVRSATSVTPSSSLNSIYRYNALFGRITYNWQDKYILNLTARRDGSSRFGSENLFHNFGAIGAAWVFSEEPIFKKLVPFLSYGKLRGSFGTTGNDKIPDYNFLSLYDVVNVTVPYQGANGYAPSRLTNPYLQWEETRKLQIGLDFGFFKDKVLLNINYSHNKSSNQLLSFALPNQTGFDDIQSNFPATIRNTGFELMLLSTNLNSPTFTWSSSINFTLPKNTLTRFTDIEKSPYASQYIIGQSVNIQKKYRYNGIDPASGLYQFIDNNGNTTFNPVAASAISNNDQFVIVNPDPKFYGGIQNAFKYKGVQLDFLFQFTKQSAQNYLLGTIPNFYTGGRKNMNLPTWQTDRWQKPGDGATAAKYSTGFSILALNASTYSDANWGDASYIRLKNLSLSWQLPELWKTYVHIKNCKVYVHGQNLLTITSYKGLDPETKNSLPLPPLRVITMGILVGL